MLHQEITEDPDLAQAIVDLTPVVLELRERSLALTAARGLKPDQRAAAQAQITELTERIAVRADRLLMPTDGLLVMINAAIAERRFPGAGADQAPTASLVDQVTAAVEREGRAHAALSAAQIEVRAATAARLDAERDYAAHAAGRAE